jgi:hypothetical protein
MSAPPTRSTGGNHRNESLRLQLLPVRAFFLLPLPQPDTRAPAVLVDELHPADSNARRIANPSIMGQATGSQIRTRPATRVGKRRYHQTPGQIAGGTKDDQGTGTGWPGLLLGRARYQLCPQWRPDRYLVKHGGAVWRRLQSFALPRGVAHP